MLFNHAVAAGLIARFRELPTRKEVKEAVQQILRGEAAAAMQYDREWAKRLTAIELDRLAFFARENAYMLSEDLMYAESAYRAEDSGWKVIIKRILIGRDDLQGVYLLLHAAEADEVFAESLRILDMLGRDVLQRIEKPLELEETEQLRRALSTNPEGRRTEPAQCWL